MEDQPRTFQASRRVLSELACRQAATNVVNQHDATPWPPPEASRAASWQSAHPSQSHARHPDIAVVQSFQLRQPEQSDTSTSKRRRGRAKTYHECAGLETLVAPIAPPLVVRCQKYLQRVRATSNKPRRVTWATWLTWKSSRHLR